MRPSVWKHCGSKRAGSSKRISELARRLELKLPVMGGLICDLHALGPAAGKSLIDPKIVASLDLASTRLTDTTEVSRPVSCRKIASTASEWRTRETSETFCSGE